MTRWDAARLTALNALVSLSLMAVMAFWISKSEQPSFALLDVAELYRIKEAEIAALLINHTVSETERAAALDHAATFGAQVSALLGALPQECRCLILNRSAVVGTKAPLPDLTPEVRRRLGLAGG